MMPNLESSPFSGIGSKRCELIDFGAEMIFVIAAGFTDTRELRTNIVTAAFLLITRREMVRFIRVTDSYQLKFANDLSNISLISDRLQQDSISFLSARWKRCLIFGCKAKFGQCDHKCVEVLHETISHDVHLPSLCSSAASECPKVSLRISRLEVNLSSQVLIAVCCAYVIPKKIVGLNGGLDFRNSNLSADLPLNGKPSDAGSNESHDTADNAARKAKPIGSMGGRTRSDDRQGYSQKAREHGCEGYKPHCSQAMVDLFHSRILASASPCVERAA